MLRLALTQLLQSVVDQLVADGRLPSGLPKVTIEDPKDPSHGDFATNFALVASKVAGMPPRQLAEIVAETITNQAQPPRGEGESGEPIQSVEVAGPGFINLRVNPEYVAQYVESVLSLGVAGFKNSASEATSRKQRINVEFVSVNPNGPITIGSGRGAAFGSTLANVLEAAGHTVHREYYINDGVNSEQMRLFAESVKAIVEGKPVPENGYRGDYVSSCANSMLVALQEDNVKSRLEGYRTGQGVYRGEYDQQDLRQRMVEIYEQLLASTATMDARSLVASLTTEKVQRLCESGMITAQGDDLATFGATFDTWFSEQVLHDNGSVKAEVDALIAKGAADERPIRHKLKLAKGGVIEDVEIEEQAGEEEDLGEEVRTGSDLPGSPDLTGPNTPAQTPANPNPSTQPTLWLRSTKFGDDMDRVVRRKDGRPTYIASDIAYHKNKFNRPEIADKLITILGPDHHGYIGRLHAVLAAIEAPPLRASGEGVGGWGEPAPVEAKLYASPEERDACRAALDKARNELDVIIYQLVRFMKDGKPAPMRKRDGNIYAIIDLIDEIGKKVKPEASQVEQRKVGKDVARFFYLMRSHDTTFDFDLDLAEKQSDENPVFYVQYAHARICSVLRKAEEAEIPHPLAPSPQSGEGGFGLLIHPKETALIKKILDLPHEVSRAAEDYGVHRLTTYGIELARAYHHFYDACRVIQPEHPELSRARLALCQATKIALQATFDLLGIEAPEQM